MVKSKKVNPLFDTKKLLFPIAIGLLVAIYMLWKNTDWQVFADINWDLSIWYWLLVALLMMVIRDLAYMYRIRVLTNKHLSWRKSFDVIMLWEFASAVTPSVVGGSAVAMFILNKERLSLGKSSAIVMITAMLDELFYIATVPLVVLIIGFQDLFPVEMNKEVFGVLFSVEHLFYLGYGFIAVLILVLMYAVFINPFKIKQFLSYATRFKWLNKWKVKLEKLGEDLVNASIEFKQKNFSFWLKTFGATLLSWTARFWVVNFLLQAFTNVDNHLLVYGRQLVMWVIMLISPTPGGVGVAEFAFDGFLQDFVPVGLVGLLVVLWRLFSYYPYLFIGMLVLPRWLRRV